VKIAQQEMHYYGVISGISKKINLVEEIDRMTKSSPQRRVSVGQGTLALMLNGMGLAISKPLYLVPDFFRTKPTELLIGKGIQPNDLNDDTLGRTLDEIADCGPSKIFSTIALKAASLYGIDTKRLHGDTSNVQVWGDYEEDGDLIAFGYPKQERSDLKQYLLSLIATFDGSVPLFMGAIRGNTSDTKHFKELLKLVEENIKNSEGDHYFILDSAVYSEENLKTLKKVFLITRVPERITAAKELKESYVASLDRLHGDSDYKFAEVCSIYGGVNQRWIVVYSRAAHDREKKTIHALVKKEKLTLEKALAKLNKQLFACPLDAEKAVIEFSKQYKFHTINIVQINKNDYYLTTGRPSKKSKKSSFYTLETKIEERLEHIKHQIKLGAIFILATTQLDEKKLPTHEVLPHYKGQSPLENRFNLLKNAACISSKVYLKNEQRIVALVMIMCLCLLIYALAERQLRKTLVIAKRTVPNQSKKPIQNPTMKWIFQMFEGVGFLTIEIQGQISQQVTNLRDCLYDVLEFLGKECMSMYLLQSTG
jgi:transposase